MKQINIYINEKLVLNKDNIKDYATSHNLTEGEEAFYIKLTEMTNFYLLSAYGPFTIESILNTGKNNFSIRYKSNLGDSIRKPYKLNSNGYCKLLESDVTDKTTDMLFNKNDFISLCDHILDVSKENTLNANVEFNLRDLSDYFDNINDDAICKLSSYEKWKYMYNKYKKEAN